MKSITIDGRLGKDAEVGTTRNGRQYLKFNVANNDFVSGNTVTEWYSVTTFDPYMIENFPKRLMKGKYVIVTGKPDTEVKVDQNRNVWLNHYIRATAIDTPSFGDRKKEDGSTALSSEMSTYTAGTQSYVAREAAAPVVETAEVPVNDAYAGGMDTSDNGDDDLPF